jgi:hypothetical protein
MNPLQDTPHGDIHPFVATAFIHQLNIGIQKTRVWAEGARTIDIITQQVISEMLHTNGRTLNERPFRRQIPKDGDVPRGKKTRIVARRAVPGSIHAGKGGFADRSYHFVPGCRQRGRHGMDATTHFGPTGHWTKTEQERLI